MGRGGGDRVGPCRGEKVAREGGEGVIGYRKEIKGMEERWGREGKEGGRKGMTEELE
ncbi:precorrin-3B C(17)-methyltransferase, partial [Thermus scotoductus]